MKRLFIVSAAVLAASMGASAGQIEIGAYAGNLATGANSGLTSNYITGASGVECVGEVLYGNSCVVTGSSAKTGWGEGGYDGQLFAGAMNGTTAPSPYSGYSKSSTTAGQYATSANGIPFAMIADSGGGQNAWVAVANDTLTIPVGVQDVTEAYLMLNNYGGVPGQQDTDVYFNFGTTSNAVTETVEVMLTNAPSSGTGGEIRSAVSCTTGTNDCTGYADGNLLTSTTINGIQVTTSNVYSGTYNSATGFNFANTSGTIQLDNQGFNLSAFDGLYLVSIGVQENDSSPTTTSANPTLSLTTLSAITIDTAPEPSTWTLLIGGFAAFGIGGFLRRQRRLEAPRS